jgi:hypothetical protein
LTAITELRQTGCKLVMKGPGGDVAEAEILVVTHVLELPRDLGFESGQATVLFEPRDDLFVGWTDAAKLHFVERR